MNIRRVTRNGFVSLAVLLLSGIGPLATVTVAADSPNCTPPPENSQAGVHWPTGSDSATFTYQCSGTYTGEWTNAYFVYDPATQIRTPLYAPDYSYDCQAGQWTMTQWDYSPADNQFHQSRVVTSAPSGIPTNCPTPGSGNSGGADNSSNGNGNDTSGANTNSPNGTSNTGPGSTNTNNSTDNNNLNSNNNTNINVTNNITGTSTTGNALVTGNTSAGNANSGSAQSMADVVNMLQSSSNALGGGSNVVTFTDNINGDVNGNLLLDPAALTSGIQNAGPGSTNTSNTNVNNNLTVNNSTNASINNNIDLTSQSGNATVSNNTSGGNATSGAAEAIANVVNMIDSAVSAGKSFIGTININGNFNGNIVVPPNFINQLLASNVPTVDLTGPGSSNSSNTNVNNNATINNTNNEGINSTVNANATSGAANVSNNTSAGNASSGKTSTTVTAFNLTGSSVIGANDLLVFVNVTGKWVGLIVNAPAGATAAEFGGGITQSGPNSNNSSNTNVNNNATLNNNNNLAINNKINTNATSGSANVTGNTKGGNATSGNAENAVNLLNVEHSSLNLSGWFGILFINVFGTWNGNFGADTSVPSSTLAGGGSLPGAFSASPPLFRFAATSAQGGSSGHSHHFVPFTGSGGNTVSSNSSTASAVLAAATTKGNNKQPLVTQPAARHFNWALAVSGSGAIVLYGLGERFFAIRRQHRI